MQDKLLGWAKELLELVHMAPKPSLEDVLINDLECIHGSISTIIETCESQCETILSLLSKPQSETETGEEQRKCEVCDAVFDSSLELNQHRKVHKRERKADFICDICQRNFFSTARLERHRRTHTGAKPFVCEQCGARYQQVNDLVRHQKKHVTGSSGGIPCPVEHCQKILATVNSLNVHKRIHTGEKPHVCPTCGKSFRTNSAARRHNIIHTGERRFACDICMKSFQTAGHLKQHSRTHKTAADDSEKSANQATELAGDRNTLENSLAYESDQSKMNVQSLGFSISPENDANLPINLVDSESHGVVPGFDSVSGDKSFQSLCDIDDSSDFIVADCPLKETIQIFVDSRAFGQTHHLGSLQLFNQADS